MILNVYADSDFLLAILKENDWLKPKANKLYEKHKGKIWTSTITIQELLLISKREGLRIELLLDAVLNLCKVKETKLDLQKMITATEIMKKYDIAVNDLYTFANKQLSEIQQPVNVHFTNEGSAILGKEVAKQINKALKK